MLLCHDRDLVLTLEIPSQQAIIPAVGDVVHVRWGREGVIGLG